MRLLDLVWLFKILISSSGIVVAGVGGERRTRSDLNNVDVQEICTTTSVLNEARDANVWGSQAMPSVMSCASHPDFGGGWAECGRPADF